MKKVCPNCNGSDKINVCHSTAEQKIKQIQRFTYEKCPTCKGTGFVNGQDSRRMVKEESLGKLENMRPKTGGD